ncbi:carboxypeptidase regulatory-like domain-containing protein [Candidatus Micrarchaeota archaeon]|nr:carboxypeptidase regulatory-like domain-containing protein [Candidatus Micrarchaeota archaeon]
MNLRAKLNELFSRLKESWPQVKKFVLPLIAIIVVAGLAWFLLQPTSTVTVSVVAGENKVDGALVEVFDDQALLAKAETKNGVVVFNNLPIKELVFKASKQGFSSRSATVNLVDQQVFSLKLSSAEEYSSSFSLRIVSGSIPVKNAEVKYSSGSESGTQLSDDSGLVRLNGLKPGVIDLIVSKNGFETNVLSFIALEGDGVRDIQLVKQQDSLKPNPSNTPDSTSFSEEGLLTVLIQDSEFNLASGIIRLYSVDGSLVEEKEFTNGVVIFEQIPIGDRVFFTVQAEGFLPYSSEEESILLSEVTTYSIVLTPAGDGFGDALRIETVDENGKKIDARVLIVSQPKTVLFDGFSIDGLLVQEVAEGTYYAVALADGYLPSNALIVDNKAKLVLKKDSSAAKISVSIKNEAGELETGASVLVTDASGLLLYPAVKTRSGSSIEFALEKSKSFVIEATKGSSFASKTITVSTDASIELTLELYVAFLDLKSIDLVSKQEVSSSFKIYSGEDLVAECSTPCSVKVPGLKYLTVETKSNGFFDSETQFDSLKPGERKIIQVFLKPVSAGDGASIALVGVYDLNNNPVKTVIPGQEYSVVLIASPNSKAVEQGVYLRIGSKDSVDSDNAGILYYSEAPIVRKSTSFNPSSVCVDLKPQFINPNSEGLFKWVELVFEDSETKQLFFKIKVKDSAKQSEKLNLFYRSWSQVESLYARSPQDAELGLDLDSSDKAFCYAETLYSAFDVRIPSSSVSPSPKPSGSPTPSVIPTPTIKPTPTPVLPPSGDPSKPAESQCSDKACGLCSQAQCIQMLELGNYCYPEYSTLPSGDSKFEVCKPGLGVVKDPNDLDPVLDKEFDIGFDANGVISIPKNEVVLSIDPVFAADAIKLNVQNNKCKAVFSVIKSNTNTESCYNLDSNNVLSFRTRDFGASGCSISVKGNTVLGDDSAFFDVWSSCDAQQKTQRIKIKVNSNSIESVSISPDDLGNGDESAKLVYVVNNKQVGLRKILVGSKQLEFTEGSGGKAVSWSGPGTLSIKEDALELKAIQYKQSTSYFSKKGELGKSIDSCTSFDCCSSGWCSASALSNALIDFKRVSKEMSEKTIYRRGGVEPGNSLGKKSFKFVTVMQAGEDASSEFSSAGFSIQSACGVLPGVYEVQALFDGSNWKYSARNLAVNENLNGGATPQLCGFMCGEGNSVKTYDHGVMCTNEQATKDHRKPKITLSYFTGLPPMWTPLIPTTSNTALGCNAANAKIKAALADPSGTSLAAAISACNAIQSPLFELQPTTNVQQALVSLLGTRTSYSRCVAFGGGQAFKVVDDVVKTTSGSFVVPSNGEYYTTTDPEGNPLFDLGSAKVDGISCTPVCKPKAGVVQPLVFGNQLTYVIRFGVGVDCNPEIPSYKQFLVALASSQLYDGLGQYIALYQSFEQIKSVFDQDAGSIFNWEDEDDFSFDDAADSVKG